MSSSTADSLKSKSCKPCEGGVEAASRDEAERLLKELDGWTLDSQGRKISRGWQARDFVSAITFFNRVAELAEEEGHHPDLHLTGYRDIKIELSTHAIGGLSENDFILAAKIDDLPIDRKGESD